MIPSQLHQTQNNYIGEKIIKKMKEDRQKSIIEEEKSIKR